MFGTLTDDQFDQSLKTRGTLYVLVDDRKVIHAATTSFKVMQSLERQHGWKGVFAPWIES